MGKKIPKGMLTNFRKQTICYIVKIIFIDLKAFG